MTMRGAGHPGPAAWRPASLGRRLRSTSSEVFNFIDRAQAKRPSPVALIDRREEGPGGEWILKSHFLITQQSEWPTVQIPYHFGSHCMHAKSEMAESEFQS